MFLLGTAIGVVLFVLWKARDCYLRVEEGQVAVVTRFGAARRTPDGKLWLAEPGFHFKWSFEEVEFVSLREQLLALGAQSFGHGAPEVPEASDHVMLADGTVIRIHSMLRYAPRRDGIERYLFGLHHRKEHMASLFSSILRNEIANIREPSSAAPGGAFALVRRDRQLVNQRIADFARRELSDLYGIDFLAVDITDILPPDELAEALNAVMSASAEADATRQRAQNECDQRVLAAERGVEIARAKASAVELEIDELGRHLSALHQTGVLTAYVARRRSEVLAEARTLFVKDGGSP
jgi:regulator of protease activity HflC (stomatin/prohibitin superfamily)